jgi:hypothetical protein
VLDAQPPAQPHSGVVVDRRIVLRDDVRTFLAGLPVVGGEIK